MKYWLLLAAAVVLLVLGLNGAAYKNAVILGKPPFIRWPWRGLPTAMPCPALAIHCLCLKRARRRFRFVPESKEGKDGKIDWIFRKKRV